MSSPTLGRLYADPLDHKIPQFIRVSTEIEQYHSSGRSLTVLQKDEPALVLKEQLKEAKGLGINPP